MTSYFQLKKVADDLETKREEKHALCEEAIVQAHEAESALRALQHQESMQDRNYQFVTWAIAINAKTVEWHLSLYHKAVLKYAVFDLDKQVAAARKKEQGKKKAINAYFRD
jgi:hypothetical protein